MADASGGGSEDGLGKRLLVLDGQPDDLGFLDAVRCAASCAAATTKSLTLRPWISAARLTMVSASGEMRASIREVRVGSWGIMNPLLTSLLYGVLPDISRVISARLLRFNYQ